MALTTQEQAALRAIVARDGGIDLTMTEIRNLAISDQKAAAAATLGSAVTVTVSNWTVPATFVAQATNATLPSLINDITAAWAAQDQTKLGALFVQLYGAAKNHLGL
jgi:hypothetical protein